MSEHETQAAFFRWLELNASRSAHLEMFYAVPNGANKSIAARVKFKREGLKSGVPDVHLPVAANGFHGLWVEFKSDKGRLSDSQKEWIARLVNAGHRVEVCRSWTQAANATIDYLSLRMERL